MALNCFKFKFLTLSIPWISCHHFFDNHQLSKLSSSSQHNSRLWLFVAVSLPDRCPYFLDWSLRLQIVANLPFGPFFDSLPLSFLSSQVHNSRVCDGSVYSCPRALSLFFPNEEEIHISGYQVHQGGRRCVCLFCKDVERKRDRLWKTSHYKTVRTEREKQLC